MSTFELILFGGLFVAVFILTVVLSIRTWDAFYWEKAARIRLAAIESLLRGGSELSKSLNELGLDNPGPLTVKIHNMGNAFAGFQKRVAGNAEDAIERIE